MDENKKQALLDKLTYIVTNTSDLSLFNTANPPTMKLWVGDRGVCQIGKALEEYYAVCNMLQGETEWRNKFSEDYIDKHAKQLLSYI